METRPADVPDALVAEAVSHGWHVPDPTVAYLPVGFGSHHWSVRGTDGRHWFASVDTAPEGSDERAELEAALTAAAVARESGLAFVVAPTRTAAAHVTETLDSTFTLALYPHVDGQTGSFHDHLDLDTARDLVERLAALHTATPALLDHGARPPADDLEVPGRSGLEAALQEASAPDVDGWPGPYGERLRAALREHTATLTAALHAHDKALAAVGDQHDRHVVTHGEPHPGNVIRTADGPVLVDWDTTRLAPPERDLWHVVARLDPDDAWDVIAFYTERTGRHLQPALLERYRLAWALADVAGYTEELRHTHTETADTATAWDAVVGTLTELAARHTSPKDEPFLGQEVTTRSSPAGP
jgi:aminoglycoside phosphotransferase (APT) family kinase protein